MQVLVDQEVKFLHRGTRREFFTVMDIWGHKNPLGSGLK
jgi:hypothetical protein